MNKQYGSYDSRPWKTNYGGENESYNSIENALIPQLNSQVYQTMDRTRNLRNNVA